MHAHYIQFFRISALQEQSPQVNRPESRTNPFCGVSKALRIHYDNTRMHAICLNGRVVTPIYAHFLCLHCRARMHGVRTNTSRTSCLLIDAGVDRNYSRETAAFTFHGMQKNELDFFCTYLQCKQSNFVDVCCRIEPSTFLVF